MEETKMEEWTGPGDLHDRSLNHDGWPKGPKMAVWRHCLDTQRPQKARPSANGVRSSLYVATTPDLFPGNIGTCLCLAWTFDYLRLTLRRLRAPRARWCLQNTEIWNTELSQDTTTEGFQN